MTRVPRAPLLLVLAAATAIRLVSWLEIRDGSLLYLHRWTESDMAFFDEWAGAIVGGDVLGRVTPRPYHSGHAGVAREAHRLLAMREPFDEAVGRRLWNRWLGEHTFYQEPLYPYVLAAIYGVAGRRVGAVIFVQALFGVAAAGLVYRLTCRLFDPGAALVAGLLAALYGPAVFHESLLLRDGLVSFVGVATLAVLAVALDRPTHRRWLFLAGLLFGVALLLKSSTLLFSAPAGALVVWCRGREWRGGVAPMVAGFFLAVLPLVARNLAVGAPPLAVAASGPHAFLYYNAADYDAFGGAATSAYAPAIMARTEGRWLPVVLETLRTHPSPFGWLRLLGAKLSAAWHWLEVPDNASYYYYRLEAPRAARLAVEFWLIAPLAAAGVIAGARRRHPSLLVLLYIATGVAGNVLFYTSSRLRLPLAIAMTPFAGLGLVEIVRGLRARRWARLGALGVATAAAAALVLRPAPPAHTGLRVADFGVANEITMHLARERAATGDGAGALRLVERRLTTEPVELRALDPRGESRLPILAASVAGSFAQLHELAATLLGEREPGDARARHVRQARLLRVIAAQFADAQGRGLDPSEDSATTGP